MPKKLDFSNKKVTTMNTNENTNISFPKGQVVEIPINLIDVGENIREPDIDADLENMAETIVDYGVIQPIHVYEENNRYIIITGSRRYKACVLKNIPTIKAIVTDKYENEIDRIKIQAIENEHRREMKASERESYMSKLLDYGLNQSDIAKLLHKNKSWISQSLQAKEFREKVQDVNNAINLDKETVDELSTKDAYYLATLSNETLNEMVANAKKGGDTAENLKTEINKDKKRKSQKKAESEKKETEENNETQEVSFTNEQLNESLGIDIAFNDDDTTNNDSEKENVSNIDLRFSITENNSKKSVTISSVSKENKKLIEFVKKQIQDFYSQEGYNID